MNISDESETHLGCASLRRILESRLDSRVKGYFVLGVKDGCVLSNISGGSFPSCSLLVAFSAWHHGQDHLLLKLLCCSVRLSMYNMPSQNKDLKVCSETYVGMKGSQGQRNL